MRSLIEYALTNALMATLLAAIVFGVTRFVRRPAVRNALWLLVLIRLLLPPVWGVPLPIDSPGRDPVTVTPPVLSMPEPVPTTELTPEELALVAAMLNEEATAKGESPVTATVPEQPRPAILATAAPATAVNEWRLVYLMAGVVWFAGTLWITGRSIHLVRKFQRMLRDAFPAPAACQHDAAELARAMGLARCPEVLFVPGRLWPSLWAPVPWRRNAKLLIPAGLWPLLDAEQRRAVLAHELSHCRRGDPWVRWLELVAVAVYWWYLPLGWVRRQLRQSEEECCDMWVVAALSGRRAYATALVETAGYLNGPEPAFSSALASGAGPVSDMQRRVTMIMRATWPARLTRVGLAAVLGLGTVGLAFGPTLGSADAQEKKELPRKEGDRPREGDRKEGDRPREGDRKEGDRPREGDRKEGERRKEADRPKDGERRPEGDRKEGERRKEADRPKDGDRPREGDRKDPREPGPAPRERVNEADVRAAREEAEAARAEFRKAVERMRSAEEKLAKAEGRPVNFPVLGGFGGGVGGPGGFPGRPGAPGQPGFPPGRPEGKDVDRPEGKFPPKDGDRPREGRPEGKFPPKDGDRPGPREGRPDAGPRGDDLQKQVEDLRKAVEDLRRALNERGRDSKRD